MIIAKHIQLVAEHTLISDASFTLSTGKIYGLSAPNGSGKSTLLRSLAGLRKSDGGTISFSDLPSQTSIKEQCFYFENSSWLDSNLTGYDYLNLINHLWKADPKHIEEAITTWQMQDFINRPIKKYSLGMKQKVILGMYQATDARYWLFDEPTLALDKQSVTTFLNYLSTARKKNKMVIFSSHAGDEVFHICDHILSITNPSLFLDGVNTNA
ncbi:ABC transporter ATP-binding protein [Lacticaseibacillus paracasei]|uniref:ATP-binding cassette domain-containing protein n=1 Tax=Lacticaseibacillus paracasei TaxID=1597 RepID=UPI00272B730C|nr:ABC transporter ATP-binding protein [Lacticaseibacillus paracasei]WKZ96350.1 ABC transporter ATP-binding protein [Lacticaseibacillus paracasei]